MKTATYSRENAEAERLEFIQEWCKEKGVDPKLADNFDRAAFEWAKMNSTFKELTRPKVKQIYSGVNFQKLRKFENNA